MTNKDYCPYQPEGMTPSSKEDCKNCDRIDYTNCKVYQIDGMMRIAFAQQRDLDEKYSQRLKQ